MYIKFDRRNDEKLHMKKQSITLLKLQFKTGLLESMTFWSIEESMCVLDVAFKKSRYFNQPMLPICYGINFRKVISAVLLLYYTSTMIVIEKRCLKVGTVCHIERTFRTIFTVTPILSVLQ